LTVSFILFNTPAIYLKDVKPLNLVPADEVERLVSSGFNILISSYIKIGITNVL